jgi:hypothetical protein
LNLAAHGISPANPSWWSPARLTKRFRLIYRKEGFRGVWFRALAEVGYRRVIISAIALDAEGPEPALPDDVTVELLTRQGIDEYLALHSMDDRSNVERRLQQGDACHCARVDGKLAAVLWSGTGSQELRYIHQTLELAPDEVYFYDGFTSPAWRNRNLMGGMLAVLMWRYARAGMRRSINAVIPENRASRRVVAKLGGKPISRRGYIGPPRFRREFHTRLDN